MTMKDHLEEMEDIIKNKVIGLFRRRQSGSGLLNS
jgi:hypothetical protein